MVLRRGAHHRRPPDVDELDRWLRRKGIQVADHEVKRCDAVLAECDDVFWFVEIGEDAGVNVRMQRLHASVEHLGKPGDVIDVKVFDPGLAEGFRGAARGYEFDAVCTKSLRKL